MIRGVIFDFDGVLVHSEPCHFQAIREAGASLGLPLDEHRYYEELVPLPDREIFRRMLRDPRQSSFGFAHDEHQLLETLLARKREIFASLVANGQIQAFPGAAQLVRDCARCAAVAICSASERATIDAVLDALSLSDLVPTIISANDVTRSKPHPEPYRTACLRMGLPPADCVALEDTDGGVTSALDAGLAVIAVCHTLPAQRLAHATRVVPAITTLTYADLCAFAQDAADV